MLISDAKPAIPVVPLADKPPMLLGHIFRDKHLSYSLLVELFQVTNNFMGSFCAIRPILFRFLILTLIYAISIIKLHLTYLLSAMSVQILCFSCLALQP